MKLVATYLHWGFYRILCDSGFHTTEDWNRFGAWWIGTISSIHYLLASYIVVGGLIDKHLFPHDFPNKIVPLAMLAILLYFAGVTDNHSWFGSRIDNLGHLKTPKEIVRAKRAAMIFLATGLILFYASLIVVLL